LPNGEQKKIFTHLEEFSLATFGRQLLLWWPEGGARTLTLIDPLEGRDVWPGKKFPNDARCSVVNDEVVGIMQKDGRFVLIHLPDGKTIADVKLEAEPLLNDITLMASGGKYYLLTQSLPDGKSPPVSIQPMPSCVRKPIHRGRLYAFDEQGKQFWAKPTVIENQFLLLDQPDRLPVISFACQTYKQRANGTSRQKMSLLAIDKRNGAVAYKASFPNSMGILDFKGDEATKTIELVMQQTSVKLTFTDKPLPPPESAKEADKAKANEKKGNLLQSFQRMINRALGDSDEGDD
jgi:hypothetical protein